MKTEWEDSEEKLKEWIDRKRSCALKFVELGYSVKWSATCKPWMIVTLEDTDDSNTVIEACGKCFLDESTYGYKDGRVSKLGIRTYEHYPFDKQNIKVLYNYDRGHDLNDLKSNELAHKLFKDFIKILN